MCVWRQPMLVCGIYPSSFKEKKKHFLIFLVLVMLVALAGTAQGALTDGLIKYYDFDSGSLLDSVGGNHLTVGGTPTVESGIIGNAYEIDAQGDYLYNTTEVAYTNITVSQWVYRTGDGGCCASNAIILGSNTFANADGMYFLGMSAGNSTVSFVASSNQCTSGGSTITLALNTWTHLVTVLDGTGGNIKLYENGVLKLNTDDADCVGTTFAPTYYGKVGDLAIQWYEGRLDEIGVWNRKLTDAEIVELWNSGAAFNPFIDIPVIDNSTYNFSSASAGENETAWRDGNEDVAITTQDTTPTIRFNTTDNAYCRIHTSDQNWTTMGNTRNCTTTGTIEHVCTLGVADQFVTSGSNQLYVACIDDAFLSENVTSSSGALEVNFIVNTTLSIGILDEDMVNISLVVDEGEEFFIFANWTWTVNDSAITNTTGLCEYSANNIITESYDFQSGVNTTACTGGACTYINHTVAFTGLHVGAGFSFIKDIYRFQLCHNGGVRSDFVISTNCTESYSLDKNLIPLCSAGYLNFTIESANCSGIADVNLSVWSTGNIPNKALRLVDDFVGIDRMTNESDIDMVYNLTSGLWLASHVHEYYEHGSTNISVNCTADGSIENETGIMTVVVVNIPPVNVLSSIWDWFTDEVTFTDNVEMKYPLISGINITGVCADDDLANVTLYLNYSSNNSNIDTKIFNVAPPIASGNINYTQSNFSTNFSFLDGTLGYIFQSCCEDTTNNITCVQAAFTAENDAPVIAWSNGTSVEVGVVPTILNWTCVDAEGETGTSYLFIDAPNLSVTPNQTGGSGYSFSLDEGTYNLTVICADTFRNSSQDDLTVLYQMACTFNASSPCDGCRYPDNELSGSMHCDNNVTITSCTYSINDFTAQTISNCSAFNFTAERGWNRMYILGQTAVGSVNVTVNFWAKDQDASIFMFPVLWAMLLVMFAGFAFGRRHGIFYVIGGIAGSVVGYQLIAFSVVLGIVFAVIMPIIGMALMWKS